MTSAFRSLSLKKAIVVASGMLLTWTLENGPG